MQDVVDVLSVLRFGSNDFLQLIQKEDIQSKFEQGNIYCKENGFKVTIVCSQPATIPFYFRSSHFCTGQNYTAVIPFDEAFRSWHPIDWGFNPFEVENFTRDTLLDQFLIGSVDQDLIQSGTTMKTLGGKEVTFTRDEEDGRLMANGIRLIEGGTPVPNGALLFIDKLLFVNPEKVKTTILK